MWRVSTECTASLLLDVGLGTLVAKRRPASSKVTPDTPKMGTGAAVQTKPPTATDSKNPVKKSIEKKPPAKKDAPKSDGLLAFNCLCLSG